MRIACLQYAPRVGEIEDNLERAEAILQGGNTDNLDLLVLPELALTGYNFSSLGQISPFLEFQESGLTSAWSRQTALRLDCNVVAGYPEKVDITDSWPADPEYYNAAVIVDSEGDVVANYRKCHLYYTDETWALEGRHGFLSYSLPRLGRIALGICMDLNPYKFQAPWSEYEFGYHSLDSNARVVIISMAWNTLVERSKFLSEPEEPDMETLGYWVSRLQPILNAESSEEVIVVFANRCGYEGDATYAGTSAVVGIQRGEIRLYGMLGRGEERLLVVDTSLPPRAKLAYVTS